MLRQDATKGEGRLWLGSVIIGQAENKHIQRSAIEIELSKSKASSDNNSAESKKDWVLLEEHRQLLIPRQVLEVDRW